MGILAQELHFQPSELWAMNVEDLKFWMERLKEAAERRSQQDGG